MEATPAGMVMPVMSRQLAKALLPRTSSDAGRVMSPARRVFSKAYAPMLVMASERLMSLRNEPWKAMAWISVTPSCRVTLVRSVQLRKRLEAMDLTPAGTMNSVRPVPSKALAPSSVTGAVMVSEDSLRLFWNMALCTLLKCPPRTTVVRGLALRKGCSALVTTAMGRLTSTVERTSHAEVPAAKDPWE